jgi:hypothetical protein
MAGETTSRSGISRRITPVQGGPVLNGAVWSTSVATTQLELNDVLEMGYLPKGVTLVGFIAYATDMDTNGTPALAWKITVGSTDVKTGVTIGQATALSTQTLTQFLGIEPVTTTAATLVKVTVTTAAATAAAGTLVLVPVYIGN